MKKLLFTFVIGLGMICSVQSEPSLIKENYDKLCAKCHGADGSGKTKMGQKLGAKDYTDAKVQAELKDAAAVKAIKNGLTVGDKTLMKPNNELTDAEVGGLVSYMRTFKK